MKQNYKGLTETEVQESRARYGANVLTPPVREAWWRKFLDKFRDPLIVILLVAGGLSVAISFYEYFGIGADLMVFFEPVGIFVAIILATGMAFLFEQRAEREFSLLNQVNDEEPVCVYRDGRMKYIPKHDVVVGDIVSVGTGDEIPADGRLQEAVRLQVDESSLTGEPIAEKETGADGDGTYPAWMVLRGTKVMEGHGVFEVKAVGDGTENGKVFIAAQIDDRVKTPLNEQLERLGGLVARASYVVAALIVIGRLADFLLTEPFTPLGFLLYVLQTIMIAVTLIVVAVPEGLPMAVTLSLAYSMRRMLKTNNLVRKMHACETMGAATVICTDKTGTLTENRMRVAEVYTGKGQGLSPSLYMNMAVNATAQLDGDEIIGNPTEGALLLWLREQGHDYRIWREETDIIDEQPFTTERKYMTVTAVHRSSTAPSSPVTYMKGAPEIVMAMCELSDEVRKDYLLRLGEYQQKGMRTLAFACQQKGGEEQVSLQKPVFQGVVSIADPVRKDVPAAVKECLQAGIDVKIVTGDTAGTAREIARQIGLEVSSGGIMDGEDFEKLSDEALKERVADLQIIARARPMDKKRLVEALQARGEVVAVTGDGTNDAPALHAAHVGLSMGNGTAVAKEASDITIIDNSFSSIGRAVMWGRSLYRNIQRFILFQMTVNVVACLIVLTGAFFDIQSPLTVTQMLWVNLIMDTFAAMALASLPPSQSVMAERPRDRQRFIISKPMRQFIIGVGLLLTIILLVLFFYDEQGGFNLHEKSVFFTVFVMLQFWNLFNAKAFLTGRSAFHGLSHCREFLFIVACIFFGQILIVQLGGQMFNVEPLSLSEWGIIVGATSFVCVIGEMARWLKGCRSQLHSKKRIFSL